MEKRVIAALVGFTFILSLAYAGLVIMMAYVTEDEIIARLLRDEIAYLQQEHQNTGAVPPPRLHFIEHYASVDEAPEAVQRALQANPANQEIFTDDDSHYHVRHLFMDGSDTGILVAEVSPLLVVTQLSGYYLGLVGLSFLLMLVAAVLVAWWLARQLTRPVMQLSAELHALDTQPANPLELTATDRTDEVGFLARTIAAAVNQLGAALNRESAFTRDVSHELRTPLTVMQNTLALSRSRPISSDEQDQLRVAANEIQQITDTLLALARQESLASEKFRLRQHLEEIVLSYHGDFQAAGLEVSLDVPPDAELSANPGLFRLLIRNLLENAARYAKTPQLNIRFTGHHLYFSNQLSDTLPNEPSSAGTRSPDSPGIGQGLYLVHRIAETMGWTVEVRQQEQEFSLRLNISP